jgi:serine/threonine-protein kinase
LYYRVAKGLAEYRAGAYYAAISNLHSSNVLQPAPQLIVAMARFRLGQASEAQAALTHAIDSFDWSPQRMRESDRREVWIYHILRREAERLITPAK